jgi:hypothetical protein
MDNLVDFIEATEINLFDSYRAPVSSLYAIDENTFATGDDDGYVMSKCMRFLLLVIEFRVAF